MTSRPLPTTAAAAPGAAASSRRLRARGGTRARRSARPAPYPTRTR
jgi:hypothetical protein